MTGVNHYLHAAMVLSIILLGMLEHPAARIVVAVALAVAALIRGMAMEAEPHNRKDDRA